MLIAVLFTIASTWKQLKCPWTDEWVKKLWRTYTRGYYSVTKKNEIMPFATTWMGPESVTLNEISHIEKKKYQMTSLICGL